MKLITKVFIILFFFAGSVYSETSFENVSLKGELRFREIHYQSESVVPFYLEGNGKKEVTYSDFFFRNRLNVQILPYLNIGSVFDIYSVFGENKGKFASSDLGIQARNVFAELKLFKTGKLTAGYTTFLLPQGFVLATNGAGLKYEQSFIDDLLTPYVSWVKAYDNSRNPLNNGIGLNNYKDNDIFIGGSKFNPAGNTANFNLFYVYDHDQEALQDPIKHLHWAGLASKFIFNNTNLDATIIYNYGELLLNDSLKPVSSFLFHLAINYEKIFGQNKVKFSGIVQGASGKPDKTYRRDQFMSINPSYGINNISVDNSAGVGIFKSGDFGGINIFTLIAGYNFKNLEVKLIYSHLRLFNSTLFFNSQFGNETDLNFLYDINNYISVNLQTGVFLPEVAYKNISNDITKKPVYEIVGSCSVKY